MPGAHFSSRCYWSSKRAGGNLVHEVNDSCMTLQAFSGSWVGEYQAIINSNSFQKSRVCRGIQHICKDLQVLRCAMLGLCCMLCWSAGDFGMRCFHVKTMDPPRFCHVLSPAALSQTLANSVTEMASQVRSLDVFQQTNLRFIFRMRVQRSGRENEGVRAVRAVRSCGPDIRFQSDLRLPRL